MRARKGLHVGPARATGGQTLHCSYKNWPHSYAEVFAKIRELGKDTMRASPSASRIFQRPVMCESTIPIRHAGACVYFCSTGSLLSRTFYTNHVCPETLVTSCYETRTNFPAQKHF
jgi:hypothetical protein